MILVEESNFFVTTCMLCMMYRENTGWPLDVNV